MPSAIAAIHPTPASRALALARLLVLSAALPLLSACAGQGATQTGFISDYDGMKPTKGHAYDLVFVSPAYVPGNYSKVIIDPVAWDPAPNTPRREPQVIAKLKANFGSTLNKALSKDYTVVTSPAPGEAIGPGVLRVRSAITNTRRANWWINAPVQVVGIAGSVVGIPGGVPPPDPGGASEELEVVDAQTGQRLAAIATYNNGKPWNPLGYYEKFGHARLAFAKAAKLLTEELHPTSS